MELRNERKLRNERFVHVSTYPIIVASTFLANNS